MYRSSSWSRASDDYYSSPKAGSITGLRISVEDNDELPMYDPTIEMAKKEKSRDKFAENAVHIIPLVLLVCALILWFFSNPDVEVGTKVETAAARIEGLTIDGDIDNDSDGTQTGFLPIADVGDVDTTKQPAKKPSRKLQNFDLNSQMVDSHLIFLERSMKTRQAQPPNAKLP